jgi:hypothetical protein
MQTANMNGSVLEMSRFTTFVLIAAVSLLSACGSLRSLNTKTPVDEGNTIVLPGKARGADDPDESTIWDAFGPQYNEQKVQVNRYIWAASLDVLDFLPVQSVDPFTGVILTGYGTPPGGRQAYRATVHVRDPALEARSLSLALQTRNGRSVSPETLRAVEDAILSRARQMRIADGKL